MGKIIDKTEFGCCQVCNCIDTGNEGYFSKKKGHNIWLCPECAEEMREEEWEGGSPKMKKRQRTPTAKRGELKVQYGELPGDSPDILYINGDGTAREDRRLLHNVFSEKRVIRSTNGSFEGYDKSLYEELESRGYDLKTLRFYIKKKEEADADKR